MLSFTDSDGVVVEGLELRNSPSFHVTFKNTHNVLVQDMRIEVDWRAQERYFRAHHPRGGEVGADVVPWLPMFPFNTDGLDPNGQNYHIRNISVLNYDDVVAVKPGYLHRPGQVCTKNITVEDSYAHLGVGMSIGSVPPSRDVHCIEDVTFRNIVFDQPLKMIYVKTNSQEEPGPAGTGYVRNVTYENIVGRDPVLWPVYIGPQQQRQPDGSGDGIWPPTQPLITIDGVTLRNVTTTGDLVGAGVIRCDKRNPCRNIVLEDVHLSGWWPRDGYICQEAYGECVDCEPRPHCLRPMRDIGAAKTAARKVADWAGNAGLKAQLWLAEEAAAAAAASASL